MRGSILVREITMQTLLGSTELQYAMMFTLQRVDRVRLDDFKPFFSDLPVDPYIQGKYRQRRLSRFKVSSDEVVKLPHGHLFQSKSYNPLVGDVKREYAELDEELIELVEFKKLLFAFSDFCTLNSVALEVGVHQIRTTCSPKNFGNPAPEGIHRDGTDLIGIFAVDRQNVQGGETHLYKNRKQDPVFKQVLNPGELLLVNDREFFHYTTPIKPETEGVGTRDVFVLTCPSLIEE